MSDRCRLYAITRHGDIVSCYGGGQAAGRCVAAFRKETATHPLLPKKFPGDAIAFDVVGKRLLMPTNRMLDGYPTQESRKESGELYDELDQLVGKVYADKADNATKLSLRIMSLVPMGHILSVSIPGNLYELSCERAQENSVVSLSGGGECRFGGLTYKVVVTDGRTQIRDFQMEQTLSCTGGRGERTLAVYGLENEQDVMPMLILARMVTLTGFPSRVKPIEVVAG